jgi:hypothetical protein
MYSVLADNGMQPSDKRPNPNAKIAMQSVPGGCVYPWFRGTRGWPKSRILMTSFWARWSDKTGQFHAMVEGRAPRCWMGTMLGC